MTTPTQYATESINSVAYHEGMTDKLDRHRKALTALAEEQAKAKTLPARRTKAVDAARAAGMTWREASLILGVTEYGLRKATKPKADPETKTTP